MGIKEYLKSKSKWLEKNSVMSNLFGIFATTILAFLLSLIPCCMTYKEANRSNEIANSSYMESQRSNVIAKESNKIAKDSYEIARKALDYTEKEFTIQQTPDIRSYIGSSAIYVGTGKPFGRDNEVIDIPLVIWNRGYGLAKDIQLVLFYNMGQGDSHILKQQDIPLLKGNDAPLITGFLPSLMDNAHDIYVSGDKMFKMKVFLSWKNASGENYNSVEAFILQTKKEGKDIPLHFVFESKYFYNTIENQKGYVEYSKQEIDF